jgi:predicted 3-demethylubiquinone-9 3-methyltransferase (glyoxalase superfamily)
VAHRFAAQRSVAPDGRVRPAGLDRRRLSDIAETTSGCKKRAGVRRRAGGPRTAPQTRPELAANVKGLAMLIAKNTICLCYDKDAEAAARFYAETFPDSAVTGMQRAPADYPSGKAGDVLTVNFTVAGIPCMGLNGGPAFRQNEAFSFQIATEDQSETDRYWKAIVDNGGVESACGWCKDRWGVSWQITPRVLIEALAEGGVVARRAFEAMMEMAKIDVAAIEAARRG